VVPPDDREFDDEIRCHLAISTQERIEQGDDPETARLAALRELGYVPAIRESMRRVWYTRWFDAAVALWQDVRIGWRSLRRARGLSAAVVLTLAVGIGANAAIFSVVRGVLLRPLVNRGEDRLLYIRQSAPRIHAANTTFSVPEIADLRAATKTIAAYGEFSTVDFTLLGFGREARVVKAGVVNGTFFDVMGLRPVHGRLLDPHDDGPDAAPAVVLTYRFWETELHGDPAVVGTTVRLGGREATVVGVLEPSVPYPADTELIANVVASPHHLGATMVTLRTHRMTELFGRLAPGATIEDARAELAAVHAAMMRAHPGAYPADAGSKLSVTRLRDQIAAPARTILLLLLGAAAIVFVVACSNVANLILARSVRREGELAIRAALGAGPGALRRTLLAEAIVLCAAGAGLGIVFAQPFLAVVVRYAARFSIRALDVTLDGTVLWVGAALAIAAAVLLAFVPRLPSPQSPAGLGLASGTARITPATKRRLRIFAIAQIACSFVLLAGAGTLLATLMGLQHARTGYDVRHVLVFDVPTPAPGVGYDDPAVLEFYDEVTARVGTLPRVERAAVGSFVPWRDAGTFGAAVPFSVEGRQPAPGEGDPRARFRIVAPGFFAVVGIPLVAGRDFTAEDRAGREPVVIVSQSVASRLFPNGDAVNKTMWWTDPYFGRTRVIRRIVGIVADADDESVVERPAQTIYHPVRQIGVGGRLFVRVTSDPDDLIPAVTEVIRKLSPEQPVERGATLARVRTQVLAPERLNAFVFTGFAGIALLLALVGVAGVLAFSVSARTREFGVRLALGSAPRLILAQVLSEGLVIAAIGAAAGAVGGYAVARAATAFFASVQLPGVVPVVAASIVLIGAAIIASLVPAARAARTDVLQAIRAE